MGGLNGLPAFFIALAKINTMTKKVKVVWKRRVKPNPGSSNINAWSTEINGISIRAVKRRDDFWHGYCEVNGKDYNVVVHKRNQVIDDLDKLYRETEKVSLFKERYDG